jgi:hypothetical protein
MGSDRFFENCMNNEGGSMSKENRQALSRIATRKEIEHRLTWCANLYGSRWKKEEAFLKDCLAVIKELEKKEEQERWRPLPKEKPNDNAVVLCTVINDNPDAGELKEVRCALYESGCFNIDGESEGSFTPIAWKPAPDPWVIEVSKNDAD